MWQNLQDDLHCAAIPRVCEHLPDPLSKFILTTVRQTAGADPRTQEVDPLPRAIFITAKKWQKFCWLKWLKKSPDFTISYRLQQFGLTQLFTKIAFPSGT